MDDANAQNQHDQNQQDQSQKKAEPPERKGVTAWQVVQSTLAAALGVQSRKNRERDFEQGKASHFIFAGIAFTLVFIGVMVAIVRVVLSGT